MTLGNIMTNTLQNGSVSVPLAAALIEFSEQLGANRRMVLQRSGLEATDLKDSEGRLSLDGFYDLIRACRELTNNPAILLEFASHADFSEVSVAGLIANASPTMLHALLQLNRYGRLAIDVPYTGESALAFERGREADFIVDRRIPVIARTELMEISFTYLITGPRAFLPKPHVLGVELVGDPPGHADAYKQVWNCPISFNATRNAIRLGTWVADHPVRLQPDYVYDILTRHADRLLETFSKPSTFSTILERLIASELHTGVVTIGWAAQQLGVSRQTIYRRLKSEDTTFEQLLDTLRHKMALLYLSERKLTVFETAFLLGYSDPSPFSRAFKRWTGIAPAAYLKPEVDRG